MPSVPSVSCGLWAKIAWEPQRMTFMFGFIEDILDVFWLSYGWVPPEQKILLVENDHFRERLGLCSWSLQFWRTPQSFSNDQLVDCVILRGCVTFAHLPIFDVFCTDFFPTKSIG